MLPRGEPRGIAVCRPLVTSHRHTPRWAMPCFLRTEPQSRLSSLPEDQSIALALKQLELPVQTNLECAAGACCP